MSEKRIIRNIVFDLGGVLVDFKPERCMEALGFSEAAKEAFRREINLHSGLTEEDLVPVIWFDGQVALSRWNTKTVRELDALEPCGEGNPKPLFALGNVHVSSPMILGHNANVLKVRLEDQNHAVRSGFIFHDPELFFDEVREAHGEKAEELLVQNSAAKDIMQLYGAPLTIRHISRMNIAW